MVTSRLDRLSLEKGCLSPNPSIDTPQARSPVRWGACADKCRCCGWRSDAASADVPIQACRQRHGCLLVLSRTWHLWRRVHGTTPRPSDLPNHRSSVGGRSSACAPASGPRL